MKILLINDYATPTGGAELLILALRDDLRKRGHDARLFSSSAQPLGATSLADYHCFGTTSRFRTLLQTANPWAWWRLRQVLAEFQPDVVEVVMFLTQLSPLILPLLKPLPSLYNAQWYRAICPIATKLLPNGSLCQSSWGFVCHRKGCLPWYDWLALMLQMHLWRRWQTCFDFTIANSRSVQQQLITEGIAPVEIVWNAVPVQSERLTLSHEPTAVFAGRCVQEKGIDLLLRAFAMVLTQVPRAKLLIAGDGPERPRLIALAKDLNLGDSVSFLGHCDRFQLPQLFAEAWVQVVPSLWAEPFGLVAAEAMMQGIAVIASNTGGLAEIVEDGTTGLQVPPGNVTALAHALLTLLQNQPLAANMGKKGRSLALAKFSHTMFVDRMLEHYHAIVSTYSATTD